MLPEIALGFRFAEEVADILAKDTNLELFLTGVFGGHGQKEHNSAAIYRFQDGEPIQASFQTKRHRWCLNEDQIRRYNLGHVLDPHRKWWEKIDLDGEVCYMMLFRPRATLSVLICEDLARYDAVRTVMNAIGPNLVIALLMDGPQLDWRWPGRYATVLADDPGSAVLTVTSLGMVARSITPGETQHREIALWKEPEGRAKVLNLPKGDHALLLSLTSKEVEQFTLDGRGDNEMTVHFGLGAVHGIRHPQPPDWLGPICEWLQSTQQSLKQGLNSEVLMAASPGLMVLLHTELLKGFAKEVATEKYEKLRKRLGTSNPIARLQASRRAPRTPADLKKLRHRGFERKNVTHR